MMPRLLNSILGGALAGAAAVVIILAALLPFALIFKIDYAPTLVSNTVIEYTPPDNAIALQNTLGAFAFPFALLGGIMLTAMIGLIIGVIFAVLRGHSIRAATLIAALAQPMIVWFLFPIHMTPIALAPFLIAGPLTALLSRRDLPLSRSIAANPISRRDLLRRAAIFVGGGIALGMIEGFPVYLAALTANRAGRILFDFKPPPARTANFSPPGITPEVTDLADFYVMRKSPIVVPPTAPDWTLVIDGLVDQPLALSFAAIQAFPRIDQFITRGCISNPIGGNLISTALMSGARLGDVLSDARIRPEATQLVFYGRDGYAESLPLADARDHGLLVYAMNGVFLPDAHGAPLKVEVPGRYGFKNMKWLARIEAVAAPFKSVWTQEGWTETAIDQTLSRIDTIMPTANGATIVGIAFAGTRGINRVEVQINDGEWQAAQLNAPPLSEDTWVQWRLDTILRGDLRVTVRGVDGAGTPQIETPMHQFPNGATGLQTLNEKI